MFFRKSGLDNQNYLNATLVRWMLVKALCADEIRRLPRHRLSACAVRFSTTAV